VRAISGYEYPPVDSTVVSYSSAVVIFYDVHIGIIRVPHIAQTDNNNRTNCRKLITSLGADKSNLEIKKKKKIKRVFGATNNYGGRRRSVWGCGCYHLLTELTCVLLVQCGTPPPDSEP
jgi:hypothetical protein